MCWDSEYKENKAVWGEEPSELACFTEKYLEKTGYTEGDFSMVDLGCGYGRDLFYLCDRFSCNVLGVDESLEAIMIALDKCSPEDREKIQFMYVQAGQQGQLRYCICLQHVPDTQCGKQEKVSRTGKGNTQTGRPAAD